MNEERTIILKMLKDGKLSVEEADALMEVLEKPAHGVEAPGYAGEAGEPSESAVESEAQGGPSGADADTPESDEAERGEEERAEAERGEAERGEEASADDDSDNLDNLGDILGDNIKRTVEGFVGRLTKSLSSLGDELGSVDISQRLRETFDGPESEATRTLATAVPQNATVVLSNGWGDILVEGEDRTDAEFVARIRVHGKDEASASGTADRIDVVSRTEGDRVIIELSEQSRPPFRRIHADWVLKVPASCGCEIRAGGGDVRVVALSGRTEVRTASGDVELVGAAGGCDVRSASGSVDLCFPPDLAGRLDLLSASGSVDAEFSDPNDLSDRATGWGGSRLTCSVRNGTTVYRARTASGGIKVHE